MHKKLILQLETATTSCSVALSENGDLLALKEQNERNIHASHITLFIEDVMHAAGKQYVDLDAVAISKGPGSYTGLRIGVSTAKGLCYALGIPLIAIDTLEAMAAGLMEQEPFIDNKTLLCPMIDARRMEVYTALFNRYLSPIEPVQAKILDEASFDHYFEEYKIIFFGDGAEKCKKLYGNRSNASFVEFQNSAAHLSTSAIKKLQMGQVENVAYFEPFYLKDFMIKSPSSSEEGRDEAKSQNS